MRILAFSKLKEAKHMNMETDTGTEDPFERILAFCKLEEAKHMDMETTSGSQCKHVLFTFTVGT